MAPLSLTGGEVATWRLLDGGERPEADERVVIPLDRFAAEADALFDTTPLVGLRLTSEQALDAVGDALDRVALIEIEFLAFKDGRPFSMARRLRDQFGFDGEIRAVGDFLPDQALFLRRCGFDSVEVGTQAAAAAVKTALGLFSRSPRWVRTVQGGAYGTA